MSGITAQWSRRCARPSAPRFVTRVYDRYAYDREKRAALETWARTLAAIVEGKPTAHLVPFTSSSAR